MSAELQLQTDAFVTPGRLLQVAREARGMTCRDAEDQLCLMPGYVEILERDDYQALRSPAFARGYVRAYGKLVGVDEKQLLETFDRVWHARQTEVKPAAVPRQPLQLQHTGLGVLISIAIAGLLVLILWWWRGTGQATGAGEARPVATPLAPAPTADAGRGV